MIGNHKQSKYKRGNHYSLNGIGNNKKIKRTKRQVIVDNNKFLIAVMVMNANVQCIQTIYHPRKLEQLKKNGIPCTGLG